MSTPIIRICPHCGRPFRSYMSTTKLVNFEGSPIRTCRGCGRKFIDHDMYEPAFSPEPPEEMNQTDIITAPLFLCALPALFFLILAIWSKRYALLFFPLTSMATYAYLVYNGIKKQDQINAKIRRDYEASKQRCADRDYIIALLDGGYKVPEDFLARVHPDLLDY